MADEQAQLEQRVKILSEQVKLLVKTEQRLYLTQREVERQLKRIDALNSFALEAPSTVLEEEILRAAFEMLAKSFPLGAGAVIFRSQGGRPLVLVRGEAEMKPLEEPDYDQSLLDAVAATPVPEDVEITGDARPEDTLPLIRWLDARYPGLDRSNRMVRRSGVVLSLSGKSPASDLIVCRSETVSYHEQVASEADLGFLRLACRHIASALMIARSRQLLERRVGQRTLELAETNAELKKRLSELASAQRQLLETSRRAGMAEVATNVLHSVGNVLNSVNVSARLVSNIARSTTASRLGKAAELLRTQPDPGRFLAEDPRGKPLIDYFETVAKTIDGERERMVEELGTLTRNIEHIKVIVSMQQSHAKAGGMIERLVLSELIEDALKFNFVSNERHGVEIVRSFGEAGEIMVDRHKLLLIIMNLLSNARHALKDVEDRRITVRTRPEGAGRVAIDVEDTGVGIPAEHMDRIFSHGFTTKVDGHGFGLHSSACAAIEIDGKLTVHSDGVGKGARFTLVFPREPSSAGEKSA